VVRVAGDPYVDPKGQSGEAVDAHRIPAIVRSPRRTAIITP
jgi:hypothetical protein